MVSGRNWRERLILLTTPPLPPFCLFLAGLSDFQSSKFEEQRWQDVAGNKLVVMMVEKCFSKYPIFCSFTFNFPFFFAQINQLKSSITKHCQFVFFSWEMQCYSQGSWIRGISFKRSVHPWRSKATCKVTKGKCKLQWQGREINRKTKKATQINKHLREKIKHNKYL